MKCSATDCDNEARRGGLCWGHVKARKRKGSAARQLPQNGARYPTRKAMLVEAALNIRDIDDPAETGMFERAWHRLRMAAKRYGTKRKTVHARGDHTHH